MNVSYQCVVCSESPEQTEKICGGQSMDVLHQSGVFRVQSKQKRAVVGSQ